MTHTANEHDQVDIQVATQYLADESAPGEDRYAFAYTITITNEGDTPARLLSRYWKITGLSLIHI